MSSRTREINKITMAIIRISVKLMLLALLILLLYEAVIRGYAFGHAVFYAEAVEAAPGHDITVVVKDGEDVSQAADELEKKGLIKNIYAFLFQSRFYDYDKIYPGTYTFNTSMTSKEIVKILASEYKMAVGGGAGYQGNGEYFLRFNIGCPRETLEKGMEILAQFVADKKGV